MLDTMVHRQFRKRSPGPLRARAWRRFRRAVCSAVVPAALLLACAAAVPVPVRAQALMDDAPAAGNATGTIEDVTVLGLNRMSRQAFLHALGVAPGDPYDPRRLRRNFKKLWDLGLFEDIVLEAEDGPGGGKVLIVKVVERPVLTSVEYEDNKVVNRTEIEDTLEERDLTPRLSNPLDMGKIFFAESAIRDLLSQKGFLSAKVEAEVRKVTESTRAVTFRISPGGKTRIREIEFVGNELYSDGKLLSSLELTQPRKWWWPWSRKNLYHEVKWDQDVSNVRDLYLDAGYLDVDIRPPVVEVRTEEGRVSERAAQVAEAAEAAKTPAEAEPPVEDPLAELPPRPTFEDDVPESERRKALARWEKQRKKAEERARKLQRKRDEEQSRKWVYLTVTIREGEPYTLGGIEISGNEKFDDTLLRRQIPLGDGMLLRNGLLEMGVERITRLYENSGHLYANVVRNIERREGERVADVRIEIEEDEAYTVDRIQFSGNSATLDSVLRREVILPEGSLYNRDALDVSKIKINQLGYVTSEEDPIIEPDDASQSVTVTFPIEEQGRNEIQVGGGYSGLDGAFFNGVYSTRNFLGRGQVLSAALQIGGLSSRYSISFQEPWFLNRPILLGFSVSRRDFDFGSSLQSTSNGFGVIVGRKVTRFSRFNIGYNYEEVDSRTQLVSTVDTGSQIITSRSKNNVSSLTPVFNYSTINNPYRPTRGESFLGSVQVAGGPLGGDTAFLKPQIELTGYTQFWRRSYVAMHFQAGYITEWEDGTTSSTVIEGIPRFQRFWIGGDTQGPRVFETRTITPLRYVTLVPDPEDPTTQTIGEVFADPALGNLPIADLVANGLSPVPIEVGGNRFFLYQAEIVFPLNEQVDIAGFLDIGDSFFEDQSFNLETARVAAGVEMRFNLPIFPVPLRLIYGFPVRKLEGDRTSSFSFSVGRSF